MSTINEKRRLIIKRTNTPGVIPTVPTIDDINTFIATDIFKGELFYNIPDNILYTRDNTGIVTISSGGPVPSYVYYTEDTTIGSEEGKILVTDGTNTGMNRVRPNDIYLETTDGIDVSGVTLESNSIQMITNSGLNNNKIYLFPDKIEIGTKIFLRSQIITTDATPSTLFTIDPINVNFGGQKLIKVFLRGVSMSDFYGITYTIMYKYDGSVTIFDYVADITPLTSFTTASTNIILNGTSIEVEVTGETTTTIQWNANIEMI